MTYYHARRELATEAGDPYRSHFAVRVELEPNNGWVLVLTPLSNSVFDYPIGPLLSIAEIDLTGYARLRRRPESHRKTSAPPLKNPMAAFSADKKPWETS
jgi:hypothetical protein